MRQRTVIGLTGNIATGKSEVGRILAQLGAHVVDADGVAHEVMRSGGPAFAAVVAAFGPEIVAADGEIDRSRLGAIVFRDQGALHRLEAIVHPLVIAEVDRRIAEVRDGVAVVEAIKLIEAGMRRRYDELWVVTAPRAVQIARLMQTRGMTEEEAALRVDAQPPQEAKAAQADRMIVNDGDVRALRRKVEMEWARLLASAVTIRVARRGDPADGAGAADVLNSVIAERRYTALAGHWTAEAEQTYIDARPRSTVRTMMRSLWRCTCRRERMSFKAWISHHPRLTAWAALAVGMVVILIWSARNVGLLPGQWAALIIATILMAGLCVWIIGWEKDEEEKPAVAGPQETPDTSKAAEDLPKTEEKR